MADDSRPRARTGEERKADALEKLGERHADVWVASASSSGSPHLVPLSLAWDGERVILVGEPSAVTVRNIIASGTARLGLGPTRDIVMIDAVLDAVVEVGDADTDTMIGETFARQADWDPRGAGEDFVFLLLRPRRMQVWREANEIAGRTVMRDGAWLH
ncbi:MAG: pyridoxamine 5'-phosphate oxidase family protein [Acidimicrobiales bacterium]